MFFWALLRPRLLKEIHFSEALDVMSNGLVTVYVLPKDIERINLNLKKLIKKDPNYLSWALNEGVKTVNALEKIVEKKIKKNIDRKEALLLLDRADGYWNQFGSFLEFTHALGRIKVELSKSQINKLSEFHNRRKEVFLSFFGYIEDICLSITEKDKSIKQKNLAYLTISEVRQYFAGELECSEINDMQDARIEGYIYYGTSDGLEEIITDMMSIQAKKLLSRTEDEINQGLKGKSVSSGIARGRVKIISIDTKLDKEDISKNIIVTTMTTPNMDVFLTKVGGIVTEEGGVLCHAAIFARETKIPTITLVKDATKILKDGDLVEVDADTGVVRKIKE